MTRRLLNLLTAVAAAHARRSSNSFTSGSICFERVRITPSRMMILSAATPIGTAPGTRAGCAASYGPASGTNMRRRSSRD
jgi:hypothetical protein